MTKNISYRSSALLNGLIRQQKEFFSLKDAKEILAGRDNPTVRKLLSDMAKRGVIMRIKEGLYYRIPYEQQPDEFFPNWHLTAAALVHPKEYYIGFYSALDIHGLITQPAMIEQVVTHEQIKPRVRQVRNVRFEFITLKRKRFFGYKKHWINDYHKVYCSDLEKTFLDCLYKPDYGGGIVEITKALYKSKDKLQPAKFREYLEKFETQAVLKRLGFVLSGLDLYPELQNFIADKISPTYAPLDPSLEKQGHYSSKWGIIDNIGFETILSSIYT